MQKKTKKRVVNPLEWGHSTLLHLCTHLFLEPLQKEGQNFVPFIANPVKLRRDQRRRPSCGFQEPLPQSPQQVLGAHQHFFVRRVLQRVVVHLFWSIIQSLFRIMVNGSSRGGIERCVSLSGVSETKQTACSNTETGACICKLWKVLVFKKKDSSMRGENKGSKYLQIKQSEYAFEENTFLHPHQSPTCKSVISEQNPSL